MISSRRSKNPPIEKIPLEQSRVSDALRRREQGSPTTQPSAQRSLARPSNINTTLLDRGLRSIWFGATYMPEYSSENRVAGGRELKKELANKEHDR